MATESLTQLFYKLFSTSTFFHLLSRREWLFVIQESFFQNLE